MIRLLSLAITSILFIGSCGGGGDEVCQGDQCVCPTNQTCVHDCTPGGAECNLQCQPGSSCDLQCAAGDSCDVECSQSGSCAVDCNGAPDCDVTCPATGCTVTNCPTGSCNVTCGLVGLPTRTGTTATCP